MKKLIVEGNEVVNLPGFAGGNARIAECATVEEFTTWCDGGDSMACRYEDRVYVKTPKSLSESGEFSLDYDCLPLEQANARIENWGSER